MTKKTELNRIRTVLQEQGRTQTWFGVCDRERLMQQPGTTLFDGFGAGSRTTGSGLGGLSPGWNKKRKRPDG
ncbi:MAG: hypothetical protein JNJ57_04700 [Saprospiraceae bacterium]|nr:hypothetical protein [Saprospiraceae bacterium]